MKLYPLQEHIFLYNYIRFLQEILLHKSCFVLHSTNTHMYLTKHYTFRCMDYRSKYFFFTHEFSSIWIPHWPIISTSNFFDGLWFKFTVITSGNVKRKYIVDNKLISIQYFSCIIYQDLEISSTIFLSRRFHFRG